MSTGSRGGRLGNRVVEPAREHRLVGELRGKDAECGGLGRELRGRFEGRAHFVEHRGVEPVKAFVSGVIEAVQRVHMPRADGRPACDPACRVRRVRAARRRRPRRGRDARVGTPGRRHRPDARARRHRAHGRDPRPRRRGPGPRTRAVPSHPRARRAHACATRASAMRVSASAGSDASGGTPSVASMIVQRCEVRMPLAPSTSSSGWAATTIAGISVMASVRRADACDGR